MRRKRAAKLEQAGREIGSILVALEPVRDPTRKRVEGTRVYLVEVRDVTPRARGRKTQKGVLCCDRLRIACEGAAGLDYVRAQLIEMAERLDGVVLVT